MGTLYEDLCSIFLEMFQTETVEKIETRILCSAHFTWKSYHF